MKILYARVSTDGQSLDRQLANREKFDMVIEEKGISGSMPFWERPRTKKLHKLIEEGKVSELHVHAIDRLGRSLKDILNTIDELHQAKVSVHIISQGLITLNKETGEVNPTTNLILQILGSVAEMERNLIRERIKHSLSIKKQNGALLGRKEGSVESIDKFMQKPKSKEIARHLKKGKSIRDVARILGYGTQLVSKVKNYL
jgi:DNA invertase Pin-like site-specific DNA recombinase